MYFFFTVHFSFPELEFFQSDDFRTQMLDILFCYSKNNNKLSYKQVCLFRYSSVSIN